MRNFIDKIKKKIDERNSWKNYSSTLPVSNNNIIMKNNIVEETKEEKIYNVFPFSKEGCRGENYDDDEIDYGTYLKYLIGKKIQLIKKDSMVKFNSLENKFNKKINDVKKYISSIKDLKFNGNLEYVKNGFNLIKDSINKFSFKKLNEPKIEVLKFYQSEGDVVYNWTDEFTSKTYVIDRTNQSKMAIVLNEGIKILRKCHLIKNNRFVEYINKKASPEIRLANAHDAYFLDKNNKQEDVVWYYPEKSNNEQVKIKMPNLISVLNLHKPQNQAYLVKGLTAASLTLAIGLSCAAPVSGLVSKVKDFIGSEKNAKQVVTVENDQMNNDDYIMYMTYGVAYDIETKKIDYEYYGKYILPTKRKNESSVNKISNIENSVINIGDNVTIYSNTIYKGVNDATNKVSGLKASYSCDKVREVELIGLNYDGKIVYSSNQKVIDEYRIKGATDTAYLTYIDDCCEGYYAADNVKKLVKTL